MSTGMKMLALAAGQNNLKAGETIRVALDYCLLNDDPEINWIDLVSDKDELFDPRKVVVVIDHQSAPCFVADAQYNYKILDFAKKHGTEFSQSGGVAYELMRRHYLKKGNVVAACGAHFSYMGASGAVALRLSAEKMVEALNTGYADVVVPNSFLVRLSGELAYNVDFKDAALTLLSRVGEGGFKGKAVEFYGDIPEHGKALLCAAAADAGAVFALFSEDMEGYDTMISFDLSEVEPVIALPGDPFHIRRIREMKFLSVQGVYVGGCYSGDIESLRQFASLMEGKHCHRGVRVVFSAVDSETFKQAVSEGVVSKLMNSGAQLVNCGCSGCRTHSFGYIDEGENLISAGGCNFAGCAGAEEANVYLTSVRAAAASALTGMLTMI